MIALPYGTAPDIEHWEESTSTRLSALMRRVRLARQDEDLLGAVELVPTLSYGFGEWSVRFKIACPEGSYELKGISDFLQRMRTGERFAYGKRLAFAHIPEMLTERSRVIGRLLAHAETARRKRDRWTGEPLPGGIGRDLALSQSELIELLDALESSLPHDLWIRLLYLHPSRVDRALLERVAAGRQVLPYLDIPVQHGDPEILAAMNRGIAPETLRGIFRTAREINPDFALRTTCMVGFPGEKKRHFDNLKNFVSEVRFDRMGAFTFFPEEGTVAAALEEQVPERTKNRRLGELMRLQEEISFGRQRCFIGRELKVLVEKIEREEGYAEGRSFREAPEVDGVIEIRNIREDLKEGDIITLRVAEAMPHDMTGEEI